MVEGVTIQGRPVGSLEELRVALALDKLRHDYFYQFRLYDVRGVKGAYVLDFLVTTTIPQSTPLEVYGEYWHEGELGRDDKQREREIMARMRHEANEMVILWGRELQDQESANAAVLREIGRR